MKPKEIHDLLLSLLLRGLGIWLLYLSIDAWYGLTDAIYYLTFPYKDSPPANLLGKSWDFVVHLLPAVYFICGAPPFLNWTTRRSKVD